MHTPEPLTLDEVHAANLLKVLQQRDVLLGKHCIAVRVDEEQFARLRVRVHGDSQQCEFRLGGNSSLTSAVTSSLKEPEKSGVGFVIVKENEQFVLRVTAAGLIVRVKVSDIDDALGDVLRQQQEHLQPATLVLPYRSRVPFCIDDQCGVQCIELLPVPTTPELNIAQGK